MLLHKAKLYIVIAYDDYGIPCVYADYDNKEDASFCASECDGFIKIVEVEA